MRDRLVAKLRWAGGLLVALLVAIVLLFEALFFSVVAGEDWVRHTHQVRVDLAEMLAALRGAEVTQRNFVVFGDPEIPGVYERERATALERLRELLQLTQDNPGQQERLHQLEAPMQEKIARMDRSIEAMRAGDRELARRQVQESRSFELSDRLSRLVDEAEAEEKRLLDQRARRVDGLRTWFIAAGILAALVVGLLIALETRRAMRLARNEDEALERSERMLAERAVLLRELTHRVGNSLTLAQSVIDLQVSQAVVPEMREELKQLRNRIAAIGQVHKRLRGDTAMDGIAFDAYIEGLCRDLALSLGVTDIEISAEPCVVPLDTAVASGMVVNELVTNAVKHGAGSDGEARIEVRFSRDGERATLCVADRGSGIAANRRDGLGMTLLSALAGQLHGDLRFHQDGGTVATLEFPLPPSTSPPARLA